MAEVVGLVASIGQIAGAGTKLSSALYHFTTSAVRAEQDVADIASDIELTSNALTSVGRVFETEDTRSVISEKAITDANNLIKRCEMVFKDIAEVVEKSRTVSKDGKKNLSAIGKLAWPMREQRVELYRRRLESLKNSLTLLLHVLQLAQKQAGEQLETRAVEQAREKIREIHQQQQDSLKCLQALEARLGKVPINGEAPPEEPGVSLQAPTVQHLHVSLARVPDAGGGTDDSRSNVRDGSPATANDVDTSESDLSATDDEGDLLSQEELAKAEKHVRKLLKRITHLQKSSAPPNVGTLCQKRQINRIYKQFCRKWETDLAQASKPQKSNRPRLADLTSTARRQQHWLEYVIPSWICGCEEEQQPNATYISIGSPQRQRQLWSSESYFSKFMQYLSPRPDQRPLWSSESYYSNFVQNMYPSANHLDPEPTVPDDDNVNQQMALLLMQSNQRASPSNNATFQIDLPEDIEEQERVTCSQELVRTPLPSRNSRNRDRTDCRTNGISEHQAWERWQNRGRTTERPSNADNNYSRGLSREERRREIELGRLGTEQSLPVPSVNVNLSESSRDKALPITSKLKEESRAKSRSLGVRPRSSSRAPKSTRSYSVSSSTEDQSDCKMMRSERSSDSSVISTHGEPGMDIVDILLHEWTIQVD